MVKLITTDSYFGLFPILAEQLKGKVNDLSVSNLVFCEAKVSLMVERFICGEFKGSFNTDVYSFGKFLRAKKQIDKLLSKEGSSMVVGRILSEISLKCFKRGALLAPALYDLIMQLKSAKITPEDIDFAVLNTNGVLKNKLTDIAVVYREYERYVFEHGFEDQSSALSYLPSIIESDKDIKNSDVYLVGYGSFTAQARSIVKSLIKSARSVTAILTEGENTQAFVNETAEFIRSACADLGESFSERKEKSDYSVLGRKVVDGAFTASKALTSELKAFEGAYCLETENPLAEITAVAQVIKSLVMKGACRYREITIAVPNAESYEEYVRSVFDTLSIPYFMDAPKKPSNHPLVKLILSYVDAIRKNLDANSVREFFKNPLVFGDKTLTDKLENYVVKYNVNYNRFLSPFIYEEDSADFSALENMRKQLADLLSSFNVRALLNKLDVKQKIEVMTELLKNSGQKEESAISEQIYTAVTGVLDQMDAILGGVKLSLSEYKSVFSGGINALKLSIIPQYNDAVFIGGYKETALAKAKYLFAVGLTAEVPKISQDVAVLSDVDIDVLKDIKVLIEPKIKVVNHRVRENVALALSAFSDGLFLSYPLFTVDGSKTVKSSVVTNIEKVTVFGKFPKRKGYLTKKQGAKTFAYTCSKFVESTSDIDFTEASTYYNAVGGKTLDKILQSANKEFTNRITVLNRPLIKGEIAPTTLEDYFKCPYKAFLSHAVRIKEREEGQVGALSVGNVVHDVLKDYAERLSEITDIDSSNAVFDLVKEKVLKKEDYKKFLSDSGTNATVNRVLSECRKYCYKTFESFNNSSLKVKSTEASFGSGEHCKFPAVSLQGGKIKLKGKIDRVDEGDKYFRILDYKTGGTDSSEKSLYAGIKLQLFLYAAAVKQEYGDQKQLAGLYYLPVSDKYLKPDEKAKTLFSGFTLSENDALISQDANFFVGGESQVVPAKLGKDGAVKNAMDGESLNAHVDYALKVSDLAAKRLSEGYIVNSPYDKTCDYCKFKGLCDFESVVPRTVGKVTENIVVDATKGEENV